MSAPPPQQPVMNELVLLRAATAVDTRSIDTTVRQVKLLLVRLCYDAAVMLVYMK